MILALAVKAPVSSNALISGLRWLARLSALALATLILVIAIGERFNPTKLKAAELALMVPFFAVWLGLSLGWRWEAIGGLLVVAGLASFYLLHFVATGFDRFPRGWAFPSLGLPGVLFLVCWFWGRHATARSQPPP